MLRRLSRLPRRTSAVTAALFLGLFGAMVWLPGSDATAISGSCLTGSSFESADGNLTVGSSCSAADEDWTNAPALSTGNDVGVGSADNAYGQGAKEDGPCPTVVYGSIPPNKSDLTRFYVSTEMVGTDHFLYVAWERSNVLGNANMDFEFNQNSSSAVCTNASNLATNVQRLDGDLLVTYDFNGSGSPDIAILYWLTSAAEGACYASSSVPCWGARQDLSAAPVPEANGAVNGLQVADTLSTPTVNLPAGTFGEAGIDLDTAGVFHPGVCTSFGSVFLNSRSSTSFTSEVKDFIAPIRTDITNCGSVAVKKVSSDDPSTLLGGAVFQLYAGTSIAAGATPVSTCTTQTDATKTNFGTCAFPPPAGTSGLLFGNYVLHELTPPVGYLGAADQPLALSAANSPYTATFSDTPRPSNLQFVKHDDAGTALAGAIFHLYTYTAGETTGHTASDTQVTDTHAVCTSLADGSCQMNGMTVAPGGYWLVETTTPSGYKTAADTYVTLALGTTTTGPAIVDPRQFKIIVLVCEDGAHPTLDQSSVTIDGSAPMLSLPTGGGGTLTDAQLCALGGADADPVYANDATDAQITHTSTTKIS